MFWENLEKSEDPNDNLEDFAQYIHNNVGSTGVYIGQLEPPRRKIKDDADENAHLNLEKSEIIKFKYANEDHRSLINGTVLAPNQGISHKVFSEQMTEDNQKIDLIKNKEPLSDKQTHANLISMICFHLRKLPVGVDYAHVFGHLDKILH